MSRPRHQSDRGRERDALATGGPWDRSEDDDDDDDSVLRAPLGTHEVPPDDQTKIESPAARQRTPAPRNARTTAPPPLPRRGDKAEDRVGDVLGSYRLLELIGKGGMGFVYRAEHVKLGREVALKVLRIDYAKRRDSVARFFQEARTVNRIRHRNIIDVTDFVELDDGTTFIIMELLRGKSLGRWAKESFDTPRMLAILVQICDGLAAAHAVGVIHRDLKPDNVIVLPTGDGAEQVKLLDFGVAKLVHRDDEDLGLETAAGSVIGTPAYMSPEQAGGLVVDRRSDIYSLGAIMYELFCGVPMFRGRSFGEYVRKHLNELPVAPRDTARGAALDPRLEDILLRCIDKVPERRYPSIEALRDDLLDALGGIETMDPGLREMPLPAPMDSGLLSPHGLRTQPPLARTEPPRSVQMAAPSDVAPPPQANRRLFIGVGVAAAIVGIAAFVIFSQPEKTAPATATATATATGSAVVSVRPERGPEGSESKGPTPPGPTKLPLLDVRFDSTPSADVLGTATTTPLCATPCAITIDPNDGGRTDLRVFTLHRDGFVDHPVEIDLASPPADVRISLTRAIGRTRPPRSTTHRSTPVARAQPATPAPTHGDTALMAPEPAPEIAKPDPAPEAPKPAKGTAKGKVDSTETLDPFHH